MGGIAIERAGHADLLQQRDDLAPPDRYGTHPERAAALMAGDVVMRRRGFRWPLIGRDMKAEAMSKAVQLVDIVGHEMAPAAAVPVPDGFIDVDGHANAPQRRRSGRLQDAV